MDPRQIGLLGLLSNVMSREWAFNESRVIANVLCVLGTGEGLPPACTQ